MFPGATFHLEALSLRQVTGQAGAAVHKEAFFVIRGNLAAALPTQPLSGKSQETD